MMKMGRGFVLDQSFRYQSRGYPHLMFPEQGLYGIAGHIHRQ